MVQPDPAEPPELAQLSELELLELLFLQRQIRLKRSTPRFMVIELLLDRSRPPDPSYVSPEWETRGVLADWIAANWSAIESQLPCKGLNRGNCRIYPCPTVRHLSCWNHAKDKIIR